MIRSFFAAGIDALFRKGKRMHKRKHKRTKMIQNVSALTLSYAFCLCFMYVFLYARSKVGLMLRALHEIRSEFSSEKKTS